MSEKDIKYIKNGKQLLKSIFKLNQSTNSEFSPIFKNSTKIPNLFNFLKNKENDIEEKIEIIQILYNLFKSNTALIYFFMKKNSSNKFSFYEPLIDLYLCKDLSNDNKEIIQKIILLIKENITLTKLPFHYIYQKLAKYFNNIDENEQLELLDENKMMNYLKLLNIFYSGEINEKNVIGQNKIIKKEIKNYIYFNGEGSGINLILNNNSINPNTNFPTIKYGISFIMWVYIDENLIQKLKENNKYLEINLVKFVINEKEFKLILKDIFSFQVCLNVSEPKTIQSNSIKVNDWNSIIFSIYNNLNNSRLSIKLFINSVEYCSVLDVPKKANILTKINSIRLFDNFIGKVSSFMIITKGINNIEANYFSNNIKYGFYKNKILFNFILDNEPNYFANCKDYEYYKKYKSNNSPKLYNLLLSEQNIKNLFAVFCPFAYNFNNYQIDDIFGNFIGHIEINDCANIYKNNNKNIWKNGGFEKLLPIIELMYSKISSNKTSNYKYIDNTILTLNTLHEYLDIIKNIIRKHPRNLEFAQNSNFFSSLSIFLQKLPSEFFDKNNFEILIEIAEEIFIHKENLNLERENYIEIILLNEKMLINYDVQKRMILWKIIYHYIYYDNTNSLINNCFNLKKICLLLRFFDSQQYSKYCCKRHIEILYDNCENDILEPNMMERTKELFLIIQIYINKYCNREDSLYLLKLLSFDISPCLQEKIIDIYLNYFSNEIIDLHTKIKNFGFLLKNNFLELIEYVFSIALFDIKTKILSLFKILFDNEAYREKFKNHFNNDKKLIKNFYNFISENLLPSQIYIKTDNNKNIESNEILNNEQVLPINNFFNQEVYKSHTKYIFTFLLELFFYKVPSTNNSENINNQDYFMIHEFIIDFLITFVSKCPFNYIDYLLTNLNNYYTENTIINKEILYSENKLYDWLIDTIFYFHNSEINHHEYTNEEIIKIQNNSLLLFKSYFAHIINEDEFNKKAYYLLKYSIHLRIIIGDKEEKKNQEVTRITRLLLETIMEIKSINMEQKTKFFFDFIIYYKNFQSLAEIKEQDLNNNNQSKNFGLNRQDTINNLVATVNNLELDTNLILEEKKEDIKNQIDEDLNKEDEYLKTNTFTYKKKDSKTNSSKNNHNISVSNISDIIPDYIFNSLELNELKIDNKIKQNNENALKNYWQDFSLFDSIINYYSSNIWGTEVLKQKVGIESGDKNEKIMEKMIKEYYENKQNRNILLQDILIFLKQKDPNKENNLSRTNILHINIILLCIALVLAKDLPEYEFWEGKFTQFFIFCVLVSININPNEIYYDLIQINIYDILGFASIFLKKWDEEKYEQLTEEVILPLLKKEKSKKPKIFNLKKGPAIFSLFELKQKNTNTSSFDDSIYFEQDRLTRFHGGIDEIRMQNFSICQDLPKNIIKDDLNINRNNNNFNVEFKGDTHVILQKIFSDKLENLKEEGKIYIEFKSFYKTEYNKQIFSENNYNDEKLRINRVIKNILISYENYIYNYGNYIYLEEKKRRKKYIKNKASLFSWNGFWSNKYLFLEHPELLKLKTKNHYTNEMIKPLLVGILDFEYYSPPFKRFDKNNLFYKNNYNYKINLDIDSILSEEIKDENKKISDNEIVINEGDNEPNILKNKYGFNFVECAYKYSYDNIWDIYQDYHKKKDFHKKLIISGKQFDPTKINEKEKNTIFKCCKVKLTHHITGYICYKDEFILFEHFPFSKEDFKNDINYDNDMGCCFGSIFIHKKNDKDKLNIKINYADIKYIFIRKYFYMETGLEFFTDRNKSYLFNFKSNSDLIRFINILFDHWHGIEIKTETKQVIGYEKKDDLNFKKKFISINKKMEQWLNNNISTMEYLMWLNIYSGRSFNDITKYPIFPWILMNYSEDKREDIQYRNLSLPMGMLEFGENSIKRKDDFMQIYESLKADLIEKFPDFNYQDYLKKGVEYYKDYILQKIEKEKENEENIIELSQIPYIYGSHYSNPTYVSHFLVRIFPFTFISIEIQGQQFDDPDRIFRSIYKTFECSTTLKTDVRELVPEFYFLPEFLVNDNNINLAQNKFNSNNQLILINDVKLPLWSNDNCINFVLELRRNIESINITSSLSSWVDLIFGLNQNGENAEENYNIFLAHTYDKMVNIEKITDIETRNSLMRLYETGITPSQIFEHETKSKSKNNRNVITLDEGKKLDFKLIKSNKFNTIKSKNYKNNELSKDSSYKKENVINSYLKISKIVALDNYIIRIFTNNGYCYDIKIEDDILHIINKFKIVESSFFELKNYSIDYACSYIMSNIDIPIVVFNNNQSIIKGGFWDGRLEINYILSIAKNININVKSNTIFSPDFNPITTIEYSNKLRSFICGSINGILYVYLIDKEYDIKFIKGLNLFDNEITSISINDNLNMLSVSSKDGFINLHILPSFDLVRTINLNKKNNNKNIENNDMIFSNNIFLSNFPLPCIVSYISSKRSFISYTINGKFISEVKEINNSYIIKSPIMYKSNNFQDILIYGTNDGFIKIRKFPEMILINSIEVFKNEMINEICISQDKKYCYAWSSGNTIALVKAIDLKKNK